MKETVVLDATPLGLLCHPRKTPVARECRNWLNGLNRAGRRVCLPEIADYEVRRELIRRKNQFSLQLLNDPVQRLEYLPISTTIMHRAAELWAQSRSTGMPTAPAHAIDADAILAAQAIELQIPTIVATSNTRHLSRYVKSALWSSIQP
jgi:predicted nucleic acid-binding protein